ncbi:MAG: hypothetical protein IJ859_09275 [Synergistaceae bacterium]|nr:hypothetical protein [Synergistaceae bacterium]
MLIKILLNEKPRTENRVRYPEVLAIVRECFYEIELAQKMGYSWKQIAQAMRKIYPEVEKYGSWWVKRYYGRIKKENEE